MTVPVVRFTVRGQDAGFDAPTSGSPGRPYTVVYDGFCNVCKRLVGILEKWDRRAELEILPSQSPGLHARFPWIPARAYTESVQVIETASGRTWQGAAALEQILDVLPKGKFISWIFSIPFARPAAEKFYRWFARNRYHLGCGEHCQLRAPVIDFDPRGASSPQRGP
jgi:predicted DCC family thiol-disulfide oxidoreductase YuxK